jgi:receptor protein-tyrosine kinase
MSIIEQAARRLEALHRAGIDVPWEAAGLEARDASAQVARSVHAGAVAASQAEAAAAVAQAQGAAAAMPAPVTLDLGRLAQAGLLVPVGGDAREPGAGASPEQTRLAEDFRRAKRALLDRVREAAATRPGGGALVVVTSAVDGEGRTTCAINLALSLALEVDTSVTLVEADVRRPQVLERLGVAGEIGLTDLLADPDLPLSRALLPTSVPGLSLLPAGTPDARSHELFAGPGMRRLVSQLIGHRPDRVVIVDAPALLRSADAGALAALATQVVVVVAAQRTPRPVVQQAFASLEGGPPVVALLNHLPDGAG